MGLLSYIAVFIAVVAASLVVGFLPVYIPLPFGLGSAVMLAIVATIIFALLSFVGLSG